MFGLPSNSYDIFPCLAGVASVAPARTLSDQRCRGPALFEESDTASLYLAVRSESKSMLVINQLHVFFCSRLSSCLQV